MVFITNEMAYNGFLNSGYEESITIMDKTRSELQQIQQQAPQANSNESPAVEEAGKSYWEKLKEQANLTDYVAAKVSDVKLSISQQMIHLEEVTSKMITNIINLIVVFSLQTVVFPVLFLYGLYHLLIYLLGLNFEDYLSDTEQ